jgi:hypothetical protein
MFAHTHSIKNVLLSSEPVTDCAVVIQRIRENYFSIKFPSVTVSLFETTQFISFHLSDDMMQIIVKPEAETDEVTTRRCTRYRVEDKRISEAVFESEIPADLLARFRGTNHLISTRRNICLFSAELQENTDGITTICVFLDSNA